MSRPGRRLRYDEAIREGFVWLLANRPEFFVIGQGLWSPWYVGNSMLELEKEFGLDRVIDTPVSEAACTGAALGAALAGRRPLVVHPRLDFLVLAADAIANQAANWSSMFGGRTRAPMTIRGIINRGGEQGAQHSQALHAWFAHLPGLRVAMPATVADARDLLVSSVLCDDPVLYIDDRWLYDLETEIPPEPDPQALYSGPRVVREGDAITVAAAGYSVRLALEAADLLSGRGLEAEVIDLRVINPLQIDRVLASVKRTGHLAAVDGGWSTCGLAAEVICSVIERLPAGALQAPPRRITLPAAPAPTSGPLEAAYYPSPERVAACLEESLRPKQP
jgi:acetoin:2,6-dichlorophenolindophenol oxidoreductase subunit beta